MRRYAQLIQDQQYTIEKLLAAGWSNREIAEHVGVHPSTIGRELKRNTAADSLRGYCAKQAADGRDSDDGGPKPPPTPR